MVIDLVIAGILVVTFALIALGIVVTRRQSQRRRALAWDDPPMSDYKLVNFEAAEDMAAKNGVEGIEAKFLRDAIESEHLGISRFRIQPNFRPPFGHKHREQEEAYVIVSGSGRFKLEDEIIDVRAGDVLRVAPTVMRAFEAGPEGIEILAIGNDRPEGGDGDLVPNWWTD